MFFVSTFYADAQVVAYSFTQLTGTYTEITGGTVLGNETTDDQRFVDPATPLGGTTATGVGFPIGFNFVFNGVAYDRFAVNNNGWVSLGMSSLGAAAVNMNSNNYYTPLGSTVTTVSDDLVARIAGLGRDLQCQIGGTLRYEILGTSPNQVLVIQWKNYRKYTATGDNFNFQIRLHETTNVVETIYGSFVCNTTASNFEAGLRAAPAATAVNFNSRTSISSWIATTNSVAASNGIAMIDVNVPINGLTFTWTPPTCPGSFGLTVNSLTNISATVTWPIPSPAPTSGYEYVISTSNTVPSGSGTATSDNFVSASALTGNTVYYVYVRSNCGSSFGTWILNGSFKTLCDSITDFVQNFDNSPTGTTFLPDCWSKGGTSANVYNTTGSVAPMSPANRLYMNISATTTAYAILPPMSNLQADTHRLRFKAYATAAGKILNVGYLTNPADVSTFVLLDIYNMPSTAATTALEFTLITSGIPVGVTNLAFNVEPGTATTIYIDDVKWELNSSCVEPTALTVSALTNSSVNLGWTNGGAETAWDVQYGPINFALGTGTIISGIATNPYNLTGLTSNTNYQFYVRGICSGPINSSWAGPFGFKTQCDEVTVFSENFDSYTSGINSIPNCWSRGGSAASTTYITTGANTPMSAANRLYMFASSTAVPPTKGYIILPAVSNLQANTHRLKFKAYATAAGRTLDVGYLTDPSNVTSFVSVQVLAMPSTAITSTQEFIFTPGALPAGVKNLAIQNPGFTGGTSTIYIDDVSWQAIPTTAPNCATGIVATPNATCGNFANTITWSITPEADGYYLSIGTSPGGTNVLNNSNLSTATTYTFTGTFNTTYYYTVTPYNAVGSAVGCIEQSFTTAATGCYCTPVYTVGKTSNDLIANVVITDTTLANNSGTAPVNPAYTYFTGQPNYTASLTTGTNYSINVTVGNFGNQNVAVWVDYNDNLTFETTERVGFTTTAIAANATGTFSIVLACNAPIGIHRIRIRDVYATSGNLIDPCASYTFGETEDYDITVVADATPAPTGNASQTFCSATNPTVASLVATGTAIKWYTVATNGTPLLSTDALVSGTYYASQTVTTCESATRLEVTATVTTNPVTPTGDSAQTFCPTTSPTLASLAVTGTGLVWYDAPTAGNVLPNTTVLTATTYYVVATNGACESARLSITTSSFCPPEVCLNATYGQYPAVTFVPNSANCDGFTSQTITTGGWAGEYSMVNVVSGQTYIFTSSISSDVITIGTNDGATAFTSGVGAVTWVATISGDVRFYTHLTGCGSSTNSRTRSVTCGIISPDLPDYVNLQYPSTLSFAQGGSDTVYGQVYEGGLTDVAPNITGQAPGITAWVGISPLGSNTNPNTWTNWVVATWNSGHVSNNDEYQATIGATLTPGTYYYATRFRLNSGAYVYGGIDSSDNGNFWDGTTYNSGVLTVIPPPAPANDDCTAAIALTSGGLFGDYPSTGTNVGATNSNPPAPGCAAFTGADVWYSVTIPASGSLTIETGAGTLTDTGMAVYSGSCTTGLTLVGCNDDSAGNGYSLITLSGRTAGEVLYVNVWEYSGGSGGTFQVSAYDASLGSISFDNANFSYYPNPVKNILNLSYTQNISSVVVFNLLGQEVVSRAVNANHSQIDMSHLPTGTYMVKVTADNQVKTIKVIKE